MSQLPEYFPGSSQGGQTFNCPENFGAPTSAIPAIGASPRYILPPPEAHGTITTRSIANEKRESGWSGRLPDLDLLSLGDGGTFSVVLLLVVGIAVVWIAVQLIKGIANIVRGLYGEHGRHPEVNVPDRRLLCDRPDANWN